MISRYYYYIPSQPQYQYYLSLCIGNIDTEAALVTYTETYLVWDKVIARLLRPYRYRDPYWSNTETRTDTETCNTETRTDPIPRTVLIRYREPYWSGTEIRTDPVPRTVLIRYRDPYWSDTENRADTGTEPILIPYMWQFVQLGTSIGLVSVRVSVLDWYGSRYRISTGLGIGSVRVSVSVRVSIIVLLLCRTREVSVSIFTYLWE